MLKIGKKVSQLNGKGLELLVSDTGLVRAEFFNGDFVRAKRDATKEEYEAETMPIKSDLDPEVEERLNKLLIDFMNGE